jgi:nickel/cobalt transporter (NicO) family protein
VVLVASALVLGFLHGLGADHLMAIAALSVGRQPEAPARQRARAFGVAVRFALGHALLLASGAAVLVLLGWSLPIVFERAGEMIGGALLVAMGAVILWGVRTGRIYGHSHPHGQEPAGHWHLHIGSPERHPSPAAHSHLPTIIGAAFALSSLRALTALAPFGGHADAVPLVTVILLIGVFALGILLSMSLFGVAFARAMSAAAAARLGRAATLTMAVMSVGLGVYWIVTA